MRWLPGIISCLAALAACSGDPSNEDCDRTYGGVIYDLSLTIVTASATSVTLSSRVLADDYYVPDAGAECGIPEVVGQTDISTEHYGLSVATTKSPCTGADCAGSPASVASGATFTLTRSSTETLQLVVSCADPTDPHCNHGHPHEFRPQAAQYCLGAGSNTLENMSENASCAN